MAEITETIRVFAEFVSRGFNRQMDSAKQRLQRFQTQAHGFNRVMAQPIERFREFTKTGKNMETTGGRLATRFRKLTHGMRGFRMEMLGVMFFGMMLQKFFTGMLRPALDLTGMFEMINVTLQSLFLPISLLIFDFLMPLMLWLINLSDSTKLMIGKIILFGAALGAILFLVGALSLGIGSVILVFGSFFNIIDKLIPDVSILGVNMSSFLEVGLGIGILSKLFSSLKGIVGGVMERILELSFVKDLMSQFNIVVDDGSSAWENFKKIFIGVIDKIKEKLNLDDNFGSIDGAIESTKGFFKGMWDDMNKRVDELSLNDLGATLKDLGKTMEDLVPSLKTIAGALRGIASAINAIKSALSGNWLFNAALDFQDFLTLTFTSNLPSTRHFTKNLPQFGDFISRPGQPTARFSPQDTIVGFKGDSLPSAGGDIFFSQTLHISVSNTDEMQRQIDDSNRRTVDELRRLIKQ